MFTRATRAKALAARNTEISFEFYFVSKDKTVEGRKRGGGGGGVGVCVYRPLVSRGKKHNNAEKGGNSTLEEEEIYRR